MKAAILPLVCTVAVACSIAGATPASDLPRLDSALFDRKYDMVEKPTEQDLDGGGKYDFTGWGTAFSLGTGQDVGTIKIDASTNGKYLISNQASGTAGDGWRAYGIDCNNDGFTVEARLKITACTGANGAICLEASADRSTINARLNFFLDRIVWNGTVLTNLDTTAWHTYRIAREPNATVHSIWVDGVLVGEDVGNGFSISSVLYRLLLGSPGSGWTGKAEVAWLRFHKGAFAPPVPNDKSRRKASTDFPNKYEMDDSDNASVPVSSATTSAWKGNVSAGASVSKSGGILSVATGGKTAWWDTADAVWKTHVVATNAYTVEFRMQVMGCTLAGADRAVNVSVGSPGTVGNMFIGTNSVQWCLSTSSGGNYLTLDTSDNTDKMHIFRIAYEGGASRHGYMVWRDGVAIGEWLVDCTNLRNYSGNALGIVRFGKAGGLNDGSYSLDYIRWDTDTAWDWKRPPNGFTLIVK